MDLKAVTSLCSGEGPQCCQLRGVPSAGEGRRAGPHGVFSVLASPGAPFQRSQHPHATSCRHFHLGPPQPQQLAPDFPLAHPVQSQPGLSPHMAPAHQHSGTLHQSLTPLPTLQFQDVTGPSFLPQALHQQYLLQQQLLEAQHRRLVSHPRWAGPGRASGGSPGGSLGGGRQLLLQLEVLLSGSERHLDPTRVSWGASVCPCHITQVWGLGPSTWRFIVLKVWEMGSLMSPAAS